MRHSQLLFRFLVTLLLFLLLPQGVFAETAVAQKNIGAAKKLITIKMRQYHFYNVSADDDSAFFFAFHKTNHNIPFGWYRVNLKKKSERAARVLSSSDFSLIFNTAFSPNYKEAIVTSKTGEIFEVNLANGKKQSLGAYISNLGYQQYSYPAYTPDGKHIILFDPWNNELLIFDARTKKIEDGIHVPGFWLLGTGGVEPPESGSNISLYEFSDDGTRMTFINGATLNLQTFTLEK